MKNKIYMHLFALLILVSVAAVFNGCKKPVEEPVSLTSEDNLEVASRQKLISFSGYDWYVKSGTEMGPGYNTWSDSEKNVWVDSKGRLHLKLTTDSRGNWTCAEVWTKKSFGTGKYTWQIEGRVDQLDKWVVFGMFNYLDPFDGNDEMDIEVARWGKSGNDNLNYTIYPALGSRYSSSKTDSKEIRLNGTYSTHQFIRATNSVTWNSFHGHTESSSNRIHTWTYSNNKGFISTQKMPVHVNLWLYSKTENTPGHAPYNGKEVEIIIHSFKFK